MRANIPDTRRRRRHASVLTVTVPSTTVSAVPAIRRPFLLVLFALLAGNATACGATVRDGDRDGRQRKQPAASWQGFQAGRWPGATWRPYAASSPFNQPIARGVRVHPRSRRYVAQMLERGVPAPIVGGTSGTEDDYGHPTYWARRGDPVYTLRPTTSWGHENLRGARVRIPRGARPAPGSDGHMTVVQPDGWEYDFWRSEVPNGRGGVLRYAAGARLRVDGPGTRGGATAADFGNLAGIMRAPELAAGRIDHALFLVIDCASGTRDFGFGARPPRDDDSAFVYPADGGGSRCSRDVDAPPLGARVQLVMTGAEIDALDAPPWKSAILRAMVRYGAYIGDTGGPGFALQAESSLTYTAFGRPDPLVSLGQRQTEAGDGLVRLFDDRYVFDVASGVDWASRLRVVAPPKP